jgi:hypothetical protein
MASGTIIGDDEKSPHQIIASQRRDTLVIPP